ncbi:MAG: hypothetical protein M3Z02_05735 [Actinomycetota bacterium]|nr:hypothetical protein [Actinomycetota bacterium]
MTRRLRPVAAAAAGLVLLPVLVLSATGSGASTPASHDVAVPASGTTTVTWTGTIPPGVNALSDCNATVFKDAHALNITVPTGLYATMTSEFTFKINWADDTNDEVLTVNGPGASEVGSSDGGTTTEVVIAKDLPSGSYGALACPFTSGPQDYTGQLTIVTKSRSVEANLPSAPSGGLGFTASVPADNQRDESEPLIEIDQAGKIYTCGPTGFSNVSDYVQVSTDGGDQFHLMGTPPRGQQGEGGGGDCGLATAPTKNADNDYQYAYAGLGPLTGFTTSTSPDGGHTLFNAGPAGNTNTARGGGADRQWLTFLDDKTVLLSYNQQVPRNVVVQRSTDGGLTYLPGSDTISSPRPQFPGPMRSMPASLVTPRATGRVAFYGWNAIDGDTSYVNFAISDNTGLKWNNCVVAKFKTDDIGGLQAFTVADADNQGNVYLAFAEKKSFHTYLTTLPASKLAQCQGGNTLAYQDPKAKPGPAWSAPVQVDRDAVRTTVFPWLTAGGAPGRVAVAFYGTETDGDPNLGRDADGVAKFKAAWNVYVNQSVNALASDRTFSQVKATTHPNHYDQVCLGGLGCATGGDRTLGDFFAIGYGATSGKLSVVFNRNNKKPDDAEGGVSTPIVLTQNAGPSNGGSDLGAALRPPLRTTSVDPNGDALVSYSELVPTPLQLPTRNGPGTNEPAMDFLSDTVGPEIDPATGAGVANGGFTVTLRLADLSDAMLQKAMFDTKSLSLLWIFQFVNGYQASTASARYSPLTGGFSFGYNDYVTDPGTCGGAVGNKCLQYPGDTEIKGKVDQSTGTIVLSVPRSKLRALAGPSGNGQRPAEVPAVVGSRLYDGTAFSLGNISPVQDVQSFLYPADNTPAMDFLVPASLPATGTGGGTGPNSGSASAGGISGNGTGSSARSTSGSLAATGLSAAVPVVALAALLLAGLLRRRSRSDR